jgi:excisionase family DNA binding protein
MKMVGEMPKKTIKPIPSILRDEGDDDVLGLEEAVAFLKTTKPTMYRWIGQGRLQGFKAGRQWRFYRRDLRKFLEYDDPTAINIDLAAVREAIKLLEERIANAEKVRRKGAKR